MKSFLKLLVWEIRLLQKNSIINVSIVVTIIYGLILFFLRDLEYFNQFLVALILNDPTVIGYFFIALAIYTEMKSGVLSAIFVSPLKLHHFLWSKVAAISLIGTLCSLALIISVRGLQFNMVSYTVGSLVICLLSALLGIITLTYTDDFLNFALRSVPIFLAFVVIPLLHYLKIFDIGWLIYLFPVQASLDLIDFGVSDTPYHLGYVLLSTAFFIPVFYYFAYQRFSQSVVLKS
jgi:fluoroquinolone transport system permease protein